MAKKSTIKGPATGLDNSDRPGGKPFVVGEYGVVRVISGRHKGKIGYYDDDADAGRSAIVYFEVPFKTPHTLVPYRNLENVDVRLIGLERFKRDHPDLARVLGLP